MRTVIFRLVPGVAAMIIGRKEKPITSVTGILADINSGDKIKKVLKCPVILHTSWTTSVAKINNKQPSLAGAETVQVLRLSAQRHAKRSLLQA